MTEYSKDELEAPSWLDKDFFTRALRAYEHDVTVEISKFDITPGSKPGEHFASIMFRVDVTYSSRKYRTDNKNIKLILKTLPLEGMKKELLKDSPAFKNEARMYSKIFPEMQRALENAGDQTKIAPPLVYANIDTEKAPVIVLLDVAPDGFQTFDGFGVTNWDTLTLIIRRLAKVHALSLLLKENGETLEDFNSHPYKDELQKTENSLMKPMLTQGFNFFVSQLPSWGEEYKVYAEKLEGKVETFFQRIVDVYNRDTPFKVLLHGDFHSKNLLYRNDCTKDEDLYFIDHQFPVWTTPAIDLYYFFNIICHSDAIENRRNELILAYYSEFNATLKKVGFRGRIPTLLDLHVELIMGSYMECFQAISFVLPRFMDYKDVDLEALALDPKGVEKLSMKCFERADFRKYMKGHLERHLYGGALE